MTDFVEPENFFKITWDELHRDTKALAWRLKEIKPWKGIVAVTRGGMVPAAIVGQEIAVRLIDTVSVVGYVQGDDNPKQLETAEVIKSSALAGDGDGWLVIDDLVDTGRTIDVLRKIMPKAHYAAVYAKPMGRKFIDTCITEVAQNTWICFPWEIYNAHKAK